MEKDYEKAQKLRNNGKIVEAIKLYKKIRTSALKDDNHSLASECLHMIGVAYYQVRKYSDAKIHLKASLQEFLKHKNEESQGIVLRDLGILARSQKNLSQAKKYLSESITKLSKIKNKGHEGITRAKMARFYADMGEFSKAYDEMHEAIKLLEKSEDKFLLSSAYLDKAKIDAQRSLYILNTFAKKDEFLKRREEIEKILES